MLLNRPTCALGLAVWDRHPWQGQLHGHVTCAVVDGLMLCYHCLEMLDNFWTKGPTFSFCSCSSQASPVGTINKRPAPVALGFMIFHTASHATWSSWERGPSKYPTNFYEWGWNRFTRSEMLRNVFLGQLRHCPTYCTGLIFCFFSPWKNWRHNAEFQKCKTEYSKASS